VEVLLKTKAFIVKRSAASEEKRSLGQVSWSKFGGAASAWSVAVERAGFR